MISPRGEIICFVVVVVVGVFTCYNMMIFNIIYILLFYVVGYVIIIVY